MVRLLAPKQPFACSLIRRAVDAVFGFTIQEIIPDKEAYQTNCRPVYWAALGMIIVCTAATIYDSARMPKADSASMM